MIIKTCIKCNNQFSYKEKFVAFTPKYRSITCGVCGTKYSVSEFSRLLFAILIAVPLMIMSLFPKIFHNDWRWLLFMVTYLPLLTLLSPLFLTLKQETLESNARKSNKKMVGMLEASGTIVLAAALIIKTIFQGPDYDIEFDAGGKAAIILLLLLFFLIVHIQSKKMDKG